MAHDTHPSSQAAHATGEADFQSTQPSDALAKKIFFITLVGAAAFCGVVFIFVLN